MRPSAAELEFKVGPSARRWDSIGAGFSARLHAEAYHRIRGVDVVLTRVAAARPERAKQFTEEFGVSAVAASAEDVLAAPDVDVDARGTRPVGREPAR